MKTILALVTCILLSSSIAFADSDVNCDNGTFKIDRIIPEGGYQFVWTFQNHLLEHFEGNNILASNTHAMGDGGSIFIQVEVATINVGSTVNGETATRADLQVPASPPNYIELELVKDTNSAGYFLTANTGPHVQKITDYYFSSCTFGSSYRAH